MILLGLGSFSGLGKEMTNVRWAYEPYFSQSGSLNAAVWVYHCILFASVGTAVYTVWVLDQRVPGTAIAGLPEHLRGPLLSEVMLTLILAAHGIV